MHLRARLPCIGDGQMDGLRLRKPALLGSATRGHPGHMTGDRGDSPARLHNFAFSSSEEVGSREFGVHEGGGC